MTSEARVKERYPDAWAWHVGRQHWKIVSSMGQGASVLGYSTHATKAWRDAAYRLPQRGD